MKLTERKLASLWNAVLNPLLLCMFLPILEGKPALSFEGVTGFWGQLALAMAIALVLSQLPAFGHLVEFCSESLGAKPGTMGAKLLETIFGATALFSIIALGETALVSGVGPVGDTTFISRWQKLLLTGWPLVVCGGVLLEPVSLALGRACARAIGVPVDELEAAGCAEVEV